MKAYDDSMFRDQDVATRLTPEHGALRVLVVDADLDAATVAAELLVQRRCQPTLAMSLDQAVRVAALILPPLVLIRVGGLAHDSVVETMARTRAINSRLVPRFGCLCSGPVAASAHKYLQAGFDHVLAAPIEPPALDAVLDSVRQHLGCGLR